MAKKTDALGPFEQLVLTAVVTLRDRAYGVPIHARVSELADKDINMGSIYVTLDRLRHKGFVSSAAFGSDARARLAETAGLGRGR